VLLLKRRLFSPRVRATTTGADILVLSVLILQCALGLLTIPFSAQHMDGSEMMKLVNWAVGGDVPRRRIRAPGRRRLFSVCTWCWG
jgi:respiratory nitrate reductase gamma subunit